MFGRNKQTPAFSQLYPPETGQGDGFVKVNLPLETWEKILGHMPPPSSFAFNIVTPVMEPLDLQAARFDFGTIQNRTVAELKQVITNNHLVMPAPPPGYGAWKKADIINFMHANRTLIR